jgi:subtilisin family serine protease
LAVGPADTLRNKLGDIIQVPPPGEPGTDFAKQQFIASLTPGNLTLPPGHSEANLFQCNVEPQLLALLTNHNVFYVKQVFVGCQLGDTLRVIGKDTIYVPDLSQIYVLFQSTGGNELQAIEDMYSLDATLYAEPNFYGQLDRTPNDPYFIPENGQWNLKDVGNGIGCQFAWDATVGSPTVKLAIIDSGIDYTEVDLGRPDNPPYFPNAKVAGGYDYGDNDNDPMDIYGHGTSCAGIAGALTNNGSLVAGIGGGWNQGANDKGIKLYALKASDINNQQTDVTSAEAIHAAADPNVFGCQILSNSYGYDSYSETLREAVNFAYRLGASFVASKGNEGVSTPHYPADYENSWVTAVAGYGRDGYYCQAGNCGYISNYGGGIDITAPGTNIWTTDVGGGVHSI